MSKTRIVHIISSLKVGGAEAMLCDLISHLDVEQFDNHVIYFYEGPHVVRLQRMGVPTYHVQGLFSLYDPFFCFRLFWLVFRLKPHCLHTSLWSANVLGGLIARLLRIPYINAVHLASNNEADDVNSKFRTLCDQMTFRGAHKIVTVSEDVAAQMRKNYTRIEPARLSVIKNGLDHEYVRNQAKKAGLSRESIGLSDRHFVIGTVGRLIPRKNHSWLIDSFASFAKEFTYARLVIVGDGPLEAQLRSHVSSLRIKDKVVFVNGQSAYGYYPLFDTFVLPSFSEGLSIALLEAMSFGIPSIVANREKIHEVIKEGKTGFIVGPMETFDLLDVFGRLKTDKKFRQKIGEQAQQHVMQEFNVDKMVQGYTAAFSQACKLL